MLRLIEFDEDLDLSFFYEQCKKEGLKNNSSQDRIWDIFKSYDKHMTWILYNDELPVGSTVAHSFDDYEKGSFRIMATTCILSKYSTFRTTYGKMGYLNGFKRHFHPSSRFFVPKCIEWCGINSKMYITTHPEKTGQMKKVHSLIMQLWKGMKLVERVDDIDYRGSLQTVWKFNAKEFLKQLDKYPLEHDFLKTDL